MINSDAFDLAFKVVMFINSDASRYLNTKTNEVLKGTIDCQEIIRLLIDGNVRRSVRISEKFTVADHDLTSHNSRYRK